MKTNRYKNYHGHPRFYELLNEIAEIHSLKNHDYAGKDNPLANLKEFGWKGIVVRLGDKYFRLKNFVKSGELKVKDESIIDTFKDTAVYSLLAIILYEEENENR
jgi:hypothetical protein